MGQVILPRVGGASFGCMRQKVLRISENPINYYCFGKLTLGGKEHHLSHHLVCPPSKKMKEHTHTLLEDCYMYCGLTRCKSHKDFCFDLKEDDVL